MLSVLSDYLFNVPHWQLLKAAKGGRSDEVAELLGQGAMLKMNDEVRLPLVPLLIRPMLRLVFSASAAFASHASRL